MFEKLALMERKYEETSARLSDPETVSDNKLYTQLMREYKNMTPIIEKYREYKKAESSNNEARELLEYGVSIGTDSRKAYLMRASIYKEEGNPEKIRDLIVSAGNIDSLLKDSIISSLEGMLA